MSVFQPFIDQAYPNYAAEAASAPSEIGPVEPVAPVQPVAPVESIENRLADEYPTPSDQLELSRAARRAEQDIAERVRSERDEQARLINARDLRRIRDNRAIRELIQSFRDYDNRAARIAYDRYLTNFVRYGSDYRANGETGAVANLRAQENEFYQNLGISRANNVTREIREGMSLAIDRWFVGEGVFTPAMLHYRSSDGFMFSPLTTPARMADRAADVLAVYERRRIASYLREMARLTPEDFVFYDPTGLDSLPLRQRREFLARVDRLLEQRNIAARAADLQYIRNTENQLALEAQQLENRAEMIRIQELTPEVNSYYAQLIDSVQQYDAGIISEIMS